MIRRYFLIVPANGRAPRVTTKAPRLCFDEVAFRIVVTVPDGWGRVQRSEIGIELPDPPVAEVTPTEVPL